LAENWVGWKELKMAGHWADQKVEMKAVRMVGRTAGKLVG
jgi:hypothetical protein